MVHAFQGNKVRIGKKLQKWQKQGPYPLAVALLGIDQLPPLWAHPTGSIFVRGSKFVAKPPRCGATQTYPHASTTAPEPLDARSNAPSLQ